MEMIAFSTSEAITFEPIKVQTRCTPQNDRVSLSFVKDEDTYGKKWPETVLEQLFKSNIHFRSVFNSSANYKTMNWG